MSGASRPRPAAPVRARCACLPCTTDRDCRRDSARRRGPSRSGTGSSLSRDETAERLLTVCRKKSPAGRASQFSRLQPKRGIPSTPPSTVHRRLSFSSENVRSRLAPQDFARLLRRHGTRARGSRASVQANGVECPRGLACRRAKDVAVDAPPTPAAWGRLVR